MSRRRSFLSVGIAAGAFAVAAPVLLPLADATRGLSCPEMLGELRIYDAEGCGRVFVFAAACGWLCAAAVVGTTHLWFRHASVGRIVTALLAAFVAGLVAGQRLQLTPDGQRFAFFGVPLAWVLAWAIALTVPLGPSARPSRSPLDGSARSRKEDRFILVLVAAVAGLADAALVGPLTARFMGEFGAIGLVVIAAVPGVVIAVVAALALITMFGGGPEASARAPASV